MLILQLGIGVVGHLHLVLGKEINDLNRSKRQFSGQLSKPHKVFMLVIWAKYTLGRRIKKGAPNYRLDEMIEEYQYPLEGRFGVVFDFKGYIDLELGDTTQVDNGVEAGPEPNLAVDHHGLVEL